VALEACYWSLVQGAAAAARPGATAIAQRKRRGKVRLRGCSCKYTPCRANCLVPAANSLRAAAVHMALPSAPRQSVCASLAGYHQLLWLQMPFQMGHPLTHLQCARCGWTLTGLRCCCDRWMRWQSWLRQCAVYSSSCLMHPRSVLLRLQAAPLTRNPMSEAWVSFRTSAHASAAFLPCENAAHASGSRTHRRRQHRMQAP